jgi:hypothetical protein
LQLINLNICNDQLAFAAIFEVLFAFAISSERLNESLHFHSVAGLFFCEQFCGPLGFAKRSEEKKIGSKKGPKQPVSHVSQDLLPGV